MKRPIFIFLLLLGLGNAQSQSTQDLFQQSDAEITYLGIDFSHVRLIGNFSEFIEAGEKNVMTIRDEYFPRWNMVVLNEREKYDIRGMLRKADIYYDIDMISALNARTSLDSMESYNTRKFTEADIERFVSGYDLKDKEGIGVVFIAECLNKSAEEAVFHFVAISMRTGEVLFHRRLRGQPQGFGFRNYWINSLYKIINDVKYYYYNEWRIKSMPAGTQA
jgi:hypothetical protein